MQARLLIIIGLLLTLLSCSTFSEALTPSIQPAETAFHLIDVYSPDEQTIVTRWELAPSYYLYRSQFLFHVITPKSVSIGQPQFPKTTLFKKYADGKAHHVFSGKFTIVLPVLYSSPPNEPLQLKIQYQGCSEYGVCYPKQTKRAQITMHAQTQALLTDGTVTPEPNTKTTSVSYLVTTLQNQHTLIILALFFGLGLLLSLTPCVLPMIPILSSIILGQKKITHRRSFGLALAYVFAMALTYAVIGLLAGLLGQSVQAALQTPWVIILFSLLMVFMAFSLFGFFNLQLPSFLRNRMATQSSYQKHGSYWGSAVMGALSTLILSPCVTPALAAAILYIAQTGHARLGATALFSMGLGMGVPLLIVGAFSAKVLPKAGRWMNGVKVFLGFVMLGVAITTVTRIFPHQHTSENTPTFQTITSITALKEQLALAKQENKPLLLDFFAAWCVSCHELDQYTLRDPRVQSLLKSYRLVRADVTANSPENQSLEKYLGVIAPPTLLFFTREGKERKEDRVVGSITAERLVPLLKATLANEGA